MLKRLLLAGCVAVAATACSRGANEGAGGTPRFQLAVTDTGFTPGTLTVPAGKPITIVVTRKTDQTCAKEIVFPDQKIRKALPLNEAVEITLPPSPPGEIAYECGMEMLYGKVVIR